MNREERQKIYRLLHQFYPNARQLRSPETLTAWGLVLENYTYEDVKTAVLRYAARNKFFPDLSDITAGLSEDTPSESHFEAVCERYAAERTERDEARKRQEAATGGPCQIRSMRIADQAAGENMMEGLFWRRHYPQDCAGCRRIAVGGACTERLMAEHIDRERADCLILKAHGREGHQGAVLKQYWRELCPLCSASRCFWYQGMTMIEEDS